MKKAVKPILFLLLLLGLAALLLLRFQQMGGEAPDAPGAEPAPQLTVPPASPAPSDIPTAAATAAPTSTPEPTIEPTPEPTPTADPNSPAGRAAALGLPAPPDVDVTSWELVLVNAAHPIDRNYEPEIAFVTASQCPQDVRISEALEAFAGDCAAAGLPVFCGSGYRSYTTQYMNYQAKAAEYGAAVAATIVAPPGTSEHQTGLCCDITDWLRAPMVPAELSQTQTFHWLNEHCAEYGFILRYPEDKQEITGIIYEPWHFRYVGVEAAAYIKENNLCLEEFLALYGVD